MPSHTQYSAPLSAAVRPPLPFDHQNPIVKSMTADNLPAVKFQEIIRDGQSTIVARMKVPTPGGHAFILRRLDTGAISLTTMFRAAFPTASEDAEKDESAWVKANYDVSGSNRGGKARFAGTWVNPAAAKELAAAYALTHILSPLTEAKPDPNTEYRKSSRAQGQSPDKPPASTAKQLPTPSPSMNPGTPNPPKRRREASPAPKPPSSASPTPPPPSTPLRRSARTASPAPISLSKPVSPKAPKTPRSPTKRKAVEVATPAGSDETAVDEDAVDVPGPDMNQDIAEQKELIEAFKAQREAARRAADESMDDSDDGEKKREREEDGAPLRFEFKEPAAHPQDRQIATNRRVRMTPERRSLAWGVGAFAAAVAAMTFIPNPWF
ncbi:hypothetical protein OF83DRAFT_1071332 [Amylostereum chailletii]|nr:hypothetical protein OF83DRAFT_1071332 [Amylostereum chailletii]